MFQMISFRINFMFFRFNLLQISRCKNIIPVPSMASTPATGKYKF